MRTSTPFVLTIGAAALFAGCGGPEPLATTPVGATNALQPKPGNKTFYYTGREQKFIVPRGVTKIKALAFGAAGAGVRGVGCNGMVDLDTGACFGRGGRVEAEIAVRPGEKFYVNVGGKGGSVFTVPAVAEAADRRTSSRAPSSTVCGPVGNARRATVSSS